MQDLPDYIQFKVFPPNPLSCIFTAASDDLLDVMASLLSMDPLKRCTTEEVSTLHFIFKGGGGKRYTYTHKFNY